MPKIGDKVTVEIQGDSASGTAVTSGSTGIKVEPGAEFRVPGRIVEDHGEFWLVELSISVSGRNRVLLPKSAYRDV